MRSSFIDTPIEALPCRSICYRRDLAVGDGIREVSNPPNSADPRGRRVGPVRGKLSHRPAAGRRLNCAESSRCPERPELRSGRLLNKDRRFLSCPGPSLLELVGERQQRGIAAHASRELAAERQARIIPVQRHRHCGCSADVV